VHRRLRSSCLLGARWLNPFAPSKQSTLERGRAARRRLPLLETATTLGRAEGEDLIEVGRGLRCPVDGRWRMLGRPVDGAYFQLARRSAINLCPRPRRSSWEQAATLGVGGLTAYRAPFTVGEPRADEEVAILGANNGPRRRPSSSHVGPAPNSRSSPRAPRRSAAQSLPGRMEVCWIRSHDGSIGSRLWTSCLTFDDGKIVANRRQSSARSSRC
jgi:hypothetical protein